jgi:hypothetical protein
MPDLKFQFDTLYKVITQLDPASAPRASRPSGQPSQPYTGTGRWISTCYCLWFSLPLSLWLATGQPGLVLYWQALSGLACLVEKFKRNPHLAIGGVEAGETIAACCVAPGAAK